MLAVLPTLLLLAACDGDEGPPVCDDAKPTVDLVDSVHTMVTVSWSGSPDEKARVEVHDGEGGVVATEWQAAGCDAHESTLIGVPAGEELEARVVTEGGHTLSTTSFTTEALPTEIPEAELSGEPGWSGVLFTTWLGTYPTAVILHPTGRVLWYLTETEGGHFFRLRKRPDDSGVRYLFQTFDQPQATSRLVDASWDGLERTVLNSAAYMPTHDFSYLEDGTVGVLTNTYGGDDGQRETGNELIEIDPTGAERLVWTSAASYPVEGETDGEWVHANVVEKDPEGDNWWVSLKNRDSIDIIDRATGETVDRIGGDMSTYTQERGASTDGQHRFQFVDGGILIHDNRDSSSTSRIAELQIDRAQKVVTLGSVVQHDPPVWDYAMGDVRRDDDGSMLVMWSSSGLLDDFGPDGTLRATISTPMGVAFGYMERWDSLPGQVFLR